MGRLLAKFVTGIVTPVKETPTGAVNGSNTAFVLSATPSTAASLIVTVNGVVVPEYTLSGTTVTLDAAPVAGQTVFVYYSK